MDDVSDLAASENIVEVTISEAMLDGKALGDDVATFFTFDFFMHETQVGDGNGRRHSRD